MNRLKVLFSEPSLLEEDLKVLSVHADVRVASSPAEEVLRREASDAEILMVEYAEITSRVINSATKLRSIVRMGTGVDNIDLQAATARKIPVINIPDYCTAAVADYAFALIISLARKITQADRAVRARRWEIWTSPSKAYCGTELEGKTLGLVGLGRIGRAVARRAEAFNMNLVAFDPYVQEKQLKGIKIKLADLSTLLERSDFVSLHAALTLETRGLIGEKQLRMMKSTANIINTSRGALIDENALVRALKEGWIAGAGLDVYEREPPDIDNPIFELENAVLTPHIAWYTEEAMRRVRKTAVEMAIGLLQGKIPKTVVNPDVLE
jgi:D-3-phosphoglycerate dehydrogenase